MRVGAPRVSTAFIWGQDQLVLYLWRPSSPSSRRLSVGLFEAWERFRDKHYVRDRANALEQSVSLNQNENNGLHL